MAMEDEQVKNLTLQVLISIRDEIRPLRQDANQRSEQMDTCESRLGINPN